MEYKYPRNVVDPRIQECQKKIRKNNTRISDCKNQIASLQEEIDDLRALRAKYVDFQNRMDESVSKTESAIGGIINIFNSALSVISGTFFSKIADVVKGPEHTRAKNSLDSAIHKIDNQISDNQNKIDSLNSQINRLTSENLNLNMKILTYKANPPMIM